MTKDDTLPDAAVKTGRITGPARLFLLPGELVCDWLSIEDPDSRLLLRLFVNLSVYGKVAVLVTLYLI